MKVSDTNLNGVLIVEPAVFGDDRGFFTESWNKDKFNGLIGYDVNFVQDNHSKSQKGILRGLHFQAKHAQSKLVRVVSGSVYDVVVDLRENSATFGKWFGIVLSAENKKQLWIPKGFAHGFVSLEEDTEFLYKCDEFYFPEFEYSLKWDDKSINIDWSIISEFESIILSAKDKDGLSFNDVKLLGLDF